MNGTNVLGYTGSFLDPVVGVYPLGNGYRMYLPWLGRFNAPDSYSPFGLGGVNSYAYCLGDPINRTDSTGHYSPERVSAELDEIIKNTSENNDMSLAADAQANAHLHAGPSRPSQINPPSVSPVGPDGLHPDWKRFLSSKFDAAHAESQALLMELPGPNATKEQLYAVANEALRRNHLFINYEGNGSDVAIYWYARFRKGSEELNSTHWEVRELMYQFGLTQPRGLPGGAAYRGKVPPDLAGLVHSVVIERLVNRDPVTDEIRPPIFENSKKPGFNPGQAFKYSDPFKELRSLYGMSAKTKPRNPE